MRERRYVNLRVESVFSIVAGSCCGWSLVEGIVGSIHERILTEHGSHFELKLLGLSKMFVCLRERVMVGGEKVEVR
jgi:hypothetical protein